MSSKKFDIITIGDCKADHFIKLDDYGILPSARGQKKLVLNYGQKIPVASFRFFAGGNPLNAAVSLARLGLRVGILTVLGADDDADRILKKIKEERIDTSLVVHDRLAETDRDAVLVTGGERTILGYHFEKKYHIPQKLDTRWIYLTSLGREFANVYDSVEKMVRGRLLSLAYNPGSRQLLGAIGHVRKMLNFADLTFVNLQEAQRICQSISPEPKQLLKKMRNLGAKTPVVTDGLRGAYAFSGSHFYKIGSFPAKRVDTTGAGDAFASAFTAAIIYGHDADEALRWGSMNAAGEIRQVGVQTGILEKSAMERILTHHKKFKAKEF